MGPTLDFFEDVGSELLFPDSGAPLAPDVSVGAAVRLDAPEVDEGVLVAVDSGGSDEAKVSATRDAENDAAHSAQRQPLPLQGQRYCLSARRV